MSTSDHPRGSLFRSIVSWPALIFALALVVRIVNLLFLSANDPSFYFPQVDSLWHHLWALDIIKHDFWGEQVYFRGPLYPYFLALIYSLSGASILLAKIVQAIGGALICLLVYQIGKTCFNTNVAKIAGLMAALYGPAIFYESELLLEWLAIFLALAMLLVLLRTGTILTVRHATLAGLIGGLSAITRPNILVIFPLIAIWILWQFREHSSIRARWISAIAFLLGVAACVLSVTIRNYIVADDPVLISSQGGVNLYIANNAAADGLTMVMPEINLNLSVPWSQFVDTTTSYASSAVGRQLKPSEVSAFWSDRAWNYIRSNPGAFLGLTGRRFIYLFSGFENPDQADLYRFSANSPILALTVFNKIIKFPFGIIAPLALIGLVLGWRNHRRLALLYLFLLGYIPTIILFLVTARHRLIAVAILLLFAASAIDTVWTYWRKRHFQSLAILCLVFAALVVVLNHNWFDLGYDNPAQFHYQRGMVFEKQGDLNSAIAEYREATKYQQLPEALNNLGYALSRTGDYSGAYSALHRAIQSRPNYADPMTNLGLLFLNNGRLDSAEFYLNQARRVAPSLPQVYLNLGDLQQRLGNPAAAESILREGLIVASRYPALYNALANLFLRQGRESEAKQLLEQVLSIDKDYAAAHVNLANILVNDRDWHGAREHYQRAIEIQPDLKPAYLNLGLLFLRTNEPDSARINFEAVLKIDPNDRQAQEGLRQLAH